eukprot:gnl/TRDRNA2_/TRDRNA2_31902_c0_seq1.p1 gnl/TRDRNA2_/TRDRNA2_31902_c0~~gnl/TRDRNA2_/TRDRNA2_31902_c0_seq1.p1  ORF type:complete len:267 (-),score=59.12 gnl/TRDRNA2_/TRDRNA2_31902_c0_seq1:189-926(-)
MQEAVYKQPRLLPDSGAQNFFEEANITEADMKIIFTKFVELRSEPVESPRHEQAVLSHDGFCQLLQKYKLASGQHHDAFFHAMDRNHDGFLDFQEFILGICAADPSTLHILNSFTGYERSQYIFDVYDTNRSGMLEFDEFACLISHISTNQGRRFANFAKVDLNDEEVKSAAMKRANDLGMLKEQEDGSMAFTDMKFEKFYELIHNEHLRGTSCLFRFSKNLIKNIKMLSRNSAEEACASPAGGA